MKSRDLIIRHAAGLAGTFALAVATTASGMQQNQSLIDRGVELQSTAHAKKLTPKRYMLLGPDGQPTTDWVPVTQPAKQNSGRGLGVDSQSRLAGIGPDCTSTTWMFDGGEIDPFTGDPVGADDCGAAPGARFLFPTDTTLIARSVSDFIVEPGTGGQVVSRVAGGFGWYVNGPTPPSSEQCFVAILMYDDMDDTCVLHPNGLPYDYLLGAVILDFAVLAGVDGYYSFDLNICQELGVDFMFRSPVDGEGALLFVLSNTFDGSIESMTPPTMAQPANWGTEPGRAGTNAWLGEFWDTDPADGLFFDECFDNSIDPGVCPANLWDSGSLCTMISFGTLHAGNVIPPGVDFLEESPTAASSASFGTGLPPVPAHFFNPGSDPFIGTIEWTGDTIDPGCGTVDTIIFRPETAVIPIPGAAPNDTSQDIPIELVALNLVSTEPITVTYGGGGSELWDVRVGLADPQPANLGGIQDAGGGGTFNMPFLVHPVFTFTRVSDLTEVVFDPGAPVNGAFSGNWTAAPPATTPLGTDFNGFFITGAQIVGPGLNVQLRNASQTSVAPNNDCINPAVKTAGLTPFDTTCATTDGPANPAGFCFDFGETQTSQDIWYQYTAPASGCDDCMLLVTTCDSLGGTADFDSDMGMYFGTDCRPDTMFQIACNDDAVMYPCGRDSFLSAMYVPVTAAQDYLIRVGGFGPGNAGTGVLNVQEVPVADGFIDQQPNGVDGYASDNDPLTDQRMSDDFRLTDPPLGGATNTINNVTIWGEYIGGDGAPIDAFTVMILEDDGNAPGALLDFQSIPPANTTHTAVPPLSGSGTVWKIDLQLPLAVNLSGGRYWISVFNDTSGDTDTFYWSTGGIDLPHAYVLGSEVTQGGLPLPTPADDMALSLVQGVPCPSDTNDDGTVNVTDLLALLADWGPCDLPCPPHCAGDVNSDCTVDVTDLLQLLADWGACN